MAENLGTIYYTVEARTAALLEAEKKATSSIDRTGKAIKEAGTTATQAAPKMKKLSAEIQGLGRSTNVVGGAFKTLIPVIGAVLTVATAKKIMSLADAWTDLQNRLRLVTNGTRELAKATQDVFDIAQSTSQEIDTIAQVYQRFAQNAKTLGLSLDEVANVTDTVAKAVAVSGASAASAEAALVQLGQAIASGVLRGEELNSVMEQTPGLAQAIARGLGITVGQLRAVAAEGKITSSELIRALQNAGDSVDEQFNTRVKTAEQAWIEMQNSIMRFVGELSSGTAMSSQLADAISAISTAIDNADLDRMSQELEGIKAIISLVIDGVTEIYNVFADNFPEAAKAVDLSMTDVALIIAKTADEAAEITRGTVGVIQKLWGTLTHNIPALFENAWIKVKSGAASFINGLADIINKPLKALGAEGLGKVTFGGEVPKELLSFADQLSKGWEESAKSLGAYERTLRRVTDRAIQSSIAGWQEDYAEKTEVATVKTEELASANDKLSKSSKAAANHAEQNKKAIDDLTMALKMATLSGQLLAVTQAKLQLNEYATADQIAKVEQLAKALYELEEAERLRTMLASVDPMEASRQRFEEEMSALKQLNEAKLLEDQRYLELKAQLEREYAENQRQLEEDHFAQQSWANEMLIKGLNNFEQATASAFTGLLTGASNSTDAIRALAAGISQELISSIVKMGFAHVKAWAMEKAAKSAAASGYAASVAGQVQANTALAAQAAYASTAAIPIVGPGMAPAAAAAAATAATALGAPAIPAAAMTVSGGRLHGGPVGADKLYRVNEDGRPEIYNASNGRQYLMPGKRGNVIPAGKAGQSSTVNVSVVVNADGTSSVTTDQNGWLQDGETIGKMVKSLVDERITRAMQPGGMIRSNI